MNQSDPHLPQTGFVTILAWVFIVLGSLSLAVSLLQSVMVVTMFDTEEFRNLAEQSGQEAEFPLSFFRGLVFGFATFSAVFVASAVALLKRRNWARLFFIGVLWFGVLWNLGSIAAQWFLFGTMDLPRPPADAEVSAPDVDQVFRVFGVAMTIFGLLTGALLAWLAIKLRSPQVRGEFTA